MTSEYDNGPQLFDTEPQQAAPAEPVKPAKRVVVKKSADQGTPEKKAAKEVSSEASAAETEPPKPKRRGRPPKNASKVSSDAGTETEKAEVKKAEVKKTQKKEAAAPEAPSVAPSVSEEAPQAPVKETREAEPPRQKDGGGSNGNNANRRQNRQKNNNNRQKNNNNFQKNRKNNRNQKENTIVEQFVADPSVPSLTVNDLSVLTLPEMRKRAKEFGFEDADILDLKKQELIVEILKAHAQAGGVILAFGALEILPDGYGFLRSPHNNYLSGTEDIYISISQVKSLSLKTGDTVRCQIRPPKDAERYFAMIRIESINYDPPEASRIRASFDSLTPLSTPTPGSTSRPKIPISQHGSSTSSLRSERDRDH